MSKLSFREGKRKWSYFINDSDSASSGKTFRPNCWPQQNRELTAVCPLTFTMEIRLLWPHRCSTFDRVNKHRPHPVPCLSSAPLGLPRFPEHPQQRPLRPSLRTLPLRSRYGKGRGKTTRHSLWQNKFPKWMWSISSEGKCWKTIVNLCWVVGWKTPPITVISTCEKSWTMKLPFC